MVSWSNYETVMDAVTITGGAPDPGESVLSPGTPVLSDSFNYGRVMNSHAVQVIAAGLSSGAGTSWELNGSLDGDNWYPLTSSAAGGPLGVSTGIPAQYVQLAVTVITPPDLTYNVSAPGTAVITAYVLSTDD